MLNKLEVENFKSIKKLELDCKKINVFIGKPNTGKSNILESVGIFSFPYRGLEEFVRFESMYNLFYDENLENEIKIKIDERILNIKFEDGIFKGLCLEKEKKFFHFDFDYNGQGSSSQPPSSLLPFKFYRFKLNPEFFEKKSDFLLPSSGKNLLTILLTHNELKKLVADILEEYGLRIVLKPQENKMELQKQTDYVIISHPYSLLSDTLQRIIFLWLLLKQTRVL